MTRSVSARLLRRTSSDFIECWPELYRTVMLFKHRKKAFAHSIVTSAHDAVIEGFPRSANSFAARAFALANPNRGPRIATHTHSPAHVTLAVRLAIPAMVLIRNPDDAIVSTTALMSQVNNGFLTDDDPRTVRDRLRLMRYWTARYATFYRRLPRRPNSYLVVRFEDAVADFGQVIGRFNKLFGTDFSKFEHGASGVNAIFERSGEHLSPSEKRNAMKQVWQTAYEHPDNIWLRDQARRVYETTLASAAGLEPDIHARKGSATSPNATL